MSHKRNPNGLLARLRARAHELLARLRAHNQSSSISLTGKHWDRGLTTAQRRAVAARDLADEVEERAAAEASGAGGGGVVVQAYPVG